MPRATVDLAALRHNLDLLRGRLTKGGSLLAAVKANAYGHGALPVATELQRNGVRWFGVATAEEAFELRRGGIDGDILLISPPLTAIPQLVAAGVSLTVADGAGLERLLQSDLPQRARVQLKVDTGMGRLGLPPEAAVGLARAISRERRLVLEAVWTHLACADEPDPSSTEQQLEAFSSFLDRLRREGMVVPMVHAANSAGLIVHPDSHFDLARAGIALYGYPPGPRAAQLAADLRPVMTLSAPVTFVKRVEPGTPISYGSTWRAQRPTTVATVRCGYADGYPRVLGNRAWALAGGRRAAVVGRVCMDQLMLDVGDAQVDPGDRVTLLGPDGPTAADLAGLAGTISYEILASVSARVERAYTR